MRLMSDCIATLLIDLDEVLVKFNDEWQKAYNEKYGDNLDMSKVNSWDMSKHVKEEVGEDVYLLFKQNGIFRYCRPMEYAYEVLQRLKNAGFEIVIVSDSPRGHAYCDYLASPSNVSNPADDKRKWVEEHLPFIPVENMIFTSQKYRVHGDVLIDDKPGTYEIFSKLGRDIILMDMPYNRHIITDQRVSNLLELESMIYKKFSLKMA